MVTMDQIVVDCGPEATVAPGDEVMLLGRQGDEVITVSEWAGCSGPSATRCSAASVPGCPGSPSRSGAAVPERCRYDAAVAAHEGPAALELLRAEALTCTKCPLAAGRTQVVFGVGDPRADLMFVGEGPGARRGPGR